jgi:hypothetical protein
MNKKSININQFRLYKQRDQNKKDRFFQNVIDSCKFYECKFLKLGFHFDFTIGDDRWNNEWPKGFNQSPYSNSVYVSIFNKLNQEIAQIRVSDHLLNSWNTLSGDVAIQKYTFDGIFQMNIFDVWECKIFYLDSQTSNIKSELEII